MGCAGLRSAPLTCSARGKHSWRGFCKHFLGRSPYCVVVLSVLLGEVPSIFLKSVSMAVLLVSAGGYVGPSALETSYVEQPCQAL